MLLEFECVSFNIQIFPKQCYLKIEPLEAIRTHRLFACKIGPYNIDFKQCSESPALSSFTMRRQSFSTPPK